MKRASATDAAAALRSDLLAWFAAHQRALPWRRDRDPYRVWISEAMLQQTRVETVIPYFERFVARFPTVDALARAPLEDVLAAWSGLGYYRRARMLQSAAQALVERHGGRFPSDRTALEALPGIGPYTAGALASIAFDRPEPLVDGNVARVFARWFGIEGDPSSRAVETQLWSRAAALMPLNGGSGVWNQALMELGALVCTPKDPRCDACPVAAHCVARREGRVGELPWLKVRRAAVPVEVEVLVVIEDGCWLLERRPASGRMAELWQLPTIELAPARADGRHGDQGLLFPTRWPRAANHARSRSLLRAGASLGELRHTITHHRIRAVVRRGACDAIPCSAPFAWVPSADIASRALTGMTRKVLRAEFASRIEGARAGKRSRIDGAQAEDRSRIDGAPAGERAPPRRRA